VLVMRESRQVRKVRGVIVAEDKNAVQALVVLSIYVTLDSMLNIDKFSQVQEGTIQEVDTPADEANIGAPFIAGDIEESNNACTGNERFYVPKVVLNQCTVALCRACRCSSRRR
jgi:hypothetical protein